MRASEGMCSRIMFDMTFIASTPSSAERPLSGAPEAWADRPWKRNFADLLDSALSTPAKFTSEACQCSTASTSLKSPARTMYTLPDPPSSAGVPYTRIVPGVPLFSSQFASAMPAETEAVPNR
jgi:hypothetical protein